MALFFATCCYDASKHQWRPLNENDFSRDPQSMYGVVFHIPRWNAETISTFLAFGNRVLIGQLSQSIILVFKYSSDVICSMAMVSGSTITFLFKIINTSKSFDLSTVPDYPKRFLN